MKLFVYVAIGAAIGGVARLALSGFVQQRAGADFPAGTLVINLTGSFLLGVLIRYALQSASVSPEMRAMLTTGFCGGYTTFSTFSYESAVLLQDGEYGRAGLYVAVSVFGALLATFAGFACAEWLLRLRARV
ncbi:MAG TPA: fluoride efflux transporter CrcB [Gemmatimonadaceae bacterium]|nr:fluoride efflux transporter CrcB [Gemmatimonadaceae bacterium]